MARSLWKGPFIDRHLLKKVEELTLHAIAQQKCKIRLKATG